MSRDRYTFSNEMKEKAHKRAELFNPEQSKNVHHIVSRFTAKKYDLPSCLIKSEINAIALERDFHAWIHGNRLTKGQLIRLLGNELSQLEMELDDWEIEWKGFAEDDYIFLAVALLGMREEYFNPQRIKKNRK